MMGRATITLPRKIAEAVYREMDWRRATADAKEVVRRAEASARAAGMLPLWEQLWTARKTRQSDGDSRTIYLDIDPDGPVARTIRDFDAAVAHNESRDAAARSRRESRSALSPAEYAIFRSLYSLLFDPTLPDTGE